VEAIREIFLFLTIGFPSAMIWPFVLYYGYHKARRKGYRPPAAALILLSCCTIGIVAMVAFFPEDTTKFALFMWSIFWVPLLFSAAALALVIYVLPRRSTRMLGELPARFPFRMAGQALFVIAGLVPPFAFVAWLGNVGTVSVGTVMNSVLLATIIVAVGKFVMRLEAAVQRSAGEAIRNDPRPPVLYLRAFYQESQFFVIGSLSQYGRWAKSLTAVMSKYLGGEAIGLTLEEYLGDAVARSIGPFVALGSPEDYVSPKGASRVYTKDEEWKTQLDDLARKAACIIVEVSKSDNLRWELEHLRAERLQEKLFVLTRPSTKPSNMAWVYWGLLWRLKGIRTVTWPEFAAYMAKLEYEIDIVDPGPGAVVGFDKRNKAVVLANGANWPEEFVDPIVASIIAREKSAKKVTRL
jgi:hypothetical protein